MGNFLIPAAIGVGANLLLSLFAPSSPPQQKGKLEDTGVPNAEYGFTLSYPFGKVRKDSLNMIWGLPLKEVRVRRRSGGKGGGGQTTDVYSYYMTAAYPIARQISSVRRVWMNQVLVYNSDTNDERSQKFLEHCTIFTGNQTTPSSVIQSKESNPVPAFTGWSYLVFNNYPISNFNGSGFPRIDIEVIGKDGPEPKVKDVIKVICKFAGLSDSRIDVSDIPDDRRIEGFDLLFDGTSFADQLEDIMRVFFIITRETKDKIIFKRQEEFSNIVFVPRSSFGAKKIGEKPTDIDEKKITHFRETPSLVTVTGINVLKNYDDISITAKDPSAIHTNELNIQTKVISIDNLFITLASRVLFLGRTQSKTYSKMFLMPAWDNLKVGDLITTNSDQNLHQEVLQITKKVRGSGYLIEIEAIRFQGYAHNYSTSLDLYVFNTLTSIQRTQYQINLSSPSIRIETTLPIGQTSSNPDTEIRVYDANNNLIFTQNTRYGLSAGSQWGTTGQAASSVLPPTIVVNNPFIPDETPREYGRATAIVIECPVVDPTDSPMGSYIAIDGNSGFRDGGIFYSEDGGESYNFALSVTKSVVGTVLSFSSGFNNASPHYIDNYNSIRVRMTSGEIEPVTLEKFLANEQLGWFSTGEILAFKNASIVSSNPLTFDISYTIRGVNGTEPFISNHVVGERFVLLTDYLVRLPLNLYDINKEVLLKVVPTGLDETNISEETAHTVRLEELKPFPAVVKSERNGNDLIISWYRRTRKNGRWIDFTDISFAEGELDSYIVRIYDGNNVKREFVTGTGARSVIYSEAEQIADWGAVQPAYTARVFQNSSYPVPFKASLPTTI